MKIIEPNVTEVTDFEGVDNFYKAVARAARICYASDKTTDDKKLVERLIESKHFSPFEHAILYLKKVPYNDIGNETVGLIYKKIIENKYTLECMNFINQKSEKEEYYAINGRIIIEILLQEAKFWDMDLIRMLDVFLENLFTALCYETNEYSKYFRSFIVDTSIGCTREMNRHHNNFYICEQSTRYCNFSKDKFGNEVAFNKPYWYDEADNYWRRGWERAMQHQSARYCNAVDKDGFNVSTDIARGLLPLDTHTRAIYTATVKEWQHIIDLRLKGTTGKPHGDIKVIAEKIQKLIYK